MKGASNYIFEARAQCHLCCVEVFLQLRFTTYFKNLPNGELRLKVFTITFHRCRYKENDVILNDCNEIKKVLMQNCILFFIKYTLEIASL